MIAYPFLLKEITVNESGRALPTAKIVRPRYVVSSLAITPTIESKSIRIFEMIYDHTSPRIAENTFNKTKYFGGSSPSTSFCV